MNRLRGQPVLGVFGGSFDPPHLGHAMLPTYLRLRGKVDRLLVAPCADHPLGKPMRAFETRLSWTRVAMAPHGDYVEVSAIEAALAAAEPGPSYTIRLLDAVAAAHTDMNVRLVVGSDIVGSGETERWHRWEDIVARYDPIVVPRRGYAPSRECVLPEISSTAVRDAETDARWDDLALWVPAQVLDRLREPTKGVVWVVGQGNVAAHVAPWLRARGFEVHALPGHELAAALAAPDRPPAPRVVWLLVTDPAITDVARTLAAHGGLATTTAILHGAGARSAHDLLAPLCATGHPVGTLHPICSLRRERVWRSALPAAAFGLEGDGPAREQALALIGDAPWLDLQALDASARVAYHGACALAANHLAVLFDAAAGVLTGQGHDAETVRAALAVLLTSSLHNLLGLGIPAGITGPVVRGDDAAVAAHVDALPEPARTLYAFLSDRLQQVVTAHRDGAAIAT